MQTFKATGGGSQDVVNVCYCAVCQLFFFENAQANLSTALLSVLSISTNTLWHQLHTSGWADRHTQTERPTHTVITHPHFLVLVILLLSSRAVLLNSHLLPIRINFNSVNINLPRLKYCLWQLVHGSKIFFPPFPSGVKGWLLKSTTSIFIKSQTPTLSCICSNLRLKQRSVKRTNVFVIHSATAISKIPLL